MSFGEIKKYQFSLKPRHYPSLPAEFNVNIEATFSIFPPGVVFNVSYSPGERTFSWTKAGVIRGKSRVESSSRRHFFNLKIFSGSKIIVRKNSSEKKVF